MLAAVALSSCHMSEDDRQSVLESTQRTNVAIATSAAVRDMRSPSDTGRLIYDPPINLRERTAANAGARQVWAPFGIATPDTVARSTARPKAAQ